MNEPQLSNVIEFKVNLDAQKDFWKLYEESAEDEVVI